METLIEALRAVATCRNCSELGIWYGNYDGDECGDTFYCNECAVELMAQPWVRRNFLTLSLPLLYARDVMENLATA